MEKVFVAKRVAAKLRMSEHSIDTALVEASEMMAEMLRARKEMKLAANVGDAAVAKVAAAVAALSEARTAMVDAHAELADLQLRIGIRTRMNTEDKVEPTTSSADLREVA